MPKEPTPHELRAQVKANLEAVQNTIARTNAVLAQTRKLLQELNESRQLHRAITERKAEQYPRPGSEQLPTPQESNFLPETVSSAEPPTK